LGDHGVVQPGAALVDAVDPDDRVEALVQEGEDAHALGELLGVLSEGEDAGPPYVRLPVVAERTDFRPGLDLERDALRATQSACLARGSHHVLRIPRARESVSRAREGWVLVGSVGCGAYCASLHSAARSSSTFAVTNAMTILQAASCVMPSGVVQ